MADFLQQLQKDHGEEIGSFGGKLVEADRIPTGLFPLDLALAAAFRAVQPRRSMGRRAPARPTSSCAPSPCTSCCGRDDVCVFFDIENSSRPGLGAAASASTPTSWS